MKRILTIPLLVVLFSAFSGCNKLGQTETHLKSDNSLDEKQKDWIEKTLSEFSIREMAGQVMIAWMPGNYISIESDDFDKALEIIESGVGGIWMMGGLPYERAAKLNALQERAKVPLLVNGGGMLGAKQFSHIRDVWVLGGGTDVPPAMAYGAIGDLEPIREAGRIIGLESRATGEHIFYGPDADVLLNLDNVLHNRTFGDDPELVGQLAAAFIEGAHEVRLLTAPGFFPGAGSLATDPHVHLPINNADRQTFDSIHFVPFSKVIHAHTDAIISSHFAIPGLTGLDTLPATLSPEVTRILREELEFDGLLGTDAMAMGGITNSYEPIEAAILAFKAGNDMILGTYSIKVADTLTALIESGDIPLVQLQNSVRRILEAKARIGLHENRMVDLNEINNIVGCSTHQQKADSAASRSIVLLRDTNNHIPINTPSDRKVLSITYEREDNETAGNIFNGILINHVISIDIARVSSSSNTSIYEDLYQRAQDVDQVILSIYLRPLLGLFEQDKISDSFIKFVKKIQSEGKEIILVSFGELEVLNDLPDLGTVMMAWSGQDVMQRAAAKAILGMNPISGHLPINIPPFHKRGDGLERESPL